MSRILLQVSAAGHLAERLAADIEDAGPGPRRLGLDRGETDAPGGAAGGRRAQDERVTLDMPHQNRDTVPHGIKREMSADDVIARLATRSPPAWNRRASVSGSASDTMAMTFTFSRFSGVDNSVHADAGMAASCNGIASPGSSCTDNLRPPDGPASITLRTP